VQGASKGSKTATVRSTDSDTSGRVTSADNLPASRCDLDYIGGVTSADSLIALPHIQHWSRNALHGTLVRRTNLCESSSQPDTCTPRVGESGGYWLPNGPLFSF